MPNAFRRRKRQSSRLIIDSLSHSALRNSKVLTIPQTSKRISIMTTLLISIKHGTTTYHMHLENNADLPKAEQFKLIAGHIHIPADRLKLICKGKRYTQDNWHELPLTPNMTFLSIGEQNEDETDVNVKDIECIMHQLDVNRNAAVRALKLHPNVIDAILYLGNQ